MLLALTTLVVGCSTADSDAPTSLMDGSPVRELPVRLEGISRPTVGTNVEVVRVTTLRAGSVSGACLGMWTAGATPHGPFVVRVGVSSTSVTFGDASRVYGCDDSPGAREGAQRWCGTSSGLLLEDGHLGDPRLDIAGCRTAAGRQMGFAWIEVGAGTRYLAVEQDGYVEVYEPAGALPVRVATTIGVDVDNSRASFRVSEHDARGRMLRRYVLEAVPAG